MRSDSFAGVESYICEVSRTLTERGWCVCVVGGDPERMRRLLPAPVQLVPASSTGQVAHALLSLRPCLVHSHMSAADLAAVVTRPLTQAALVSTRHFAAHRGSHPVSRRLLALGLAAVDVRIAISEFVRARDERERVLLNGVRSRALVVPDERDQTVLVLQRLEPEKDTITALRAWAGSALRFHGWKLLIAGTGSQRDLLQAEAGKLGVGESTKFLGFIDDPDFLLARCGALLAPAPAEPFGLAVVEAMASGTPVVAAGSGGHLESLGPAAWTFAPGDPAKGALQLDRLAGDPACVRTYGRALQARQRGLLSIERHVDGLEMLYRVALQRRGGSVR